MRAAPRGRDGGVMRFEEMVLLIEAASGEAGGGRRRCTVRVVAAPIGRGAQHSDLLYAPAELGGLSLEMEAAVRGSGPGEAGSRDLARVGEPGAPRAGRQAGERLFAALFASAVRDAFVQCISAAEATSDTGLRICIEVDPDLPEGEEIGSLPWELLYQPDRRRHLAADVRTPVVRRLLAPGPTTAPPPQRLLRILAVSASPAGAPPLDLAREVAGLAAAWKWSWRVGVELLPHASLSALAAKLASGRYHALHFMGHGDFDAASGAGCLLFEDEAGQAQRVSGSRLGEVLQDRRSLRLVVLNACDTGRLPRRRGQDPYSGVASALVMAGIPAVVAMQFPISDCAAMAFSGHFYRALASGLPVEAAAAAGRQGILTDFPDSLEWATPALFLSAPDGQIMRFARRTWPRWAAAALLVLGLAGGLRHAFLGGGPPRIAAAEARQHVHQEARVCGYVAQTKYAESATGKPSFLDFERPFPDSPFSVVIWGDNGDRARFAEPPELMYLHQDVCVSGRIELYGGKPQIEVRDPARLEIEPR